MRRDASSVRAYGTYGALDGSSPQARVSSCPATPSQRSPFAAPFPPPRKSVPGLSFTHYAGVPFGLLRRQRQEPAVDLQAFTGDELRMPGSQVTQHVDWTEEYRWRTPGEVASGGVWKLWNRCQGWIAVVITGIVVGTVGAMVDLSTLWMHQLTKGTCVESWWLPLQFCDPTDKGVFQTWAAVFSIPEAHGWWAQSALYIVLCCAMTLLGSWMTLTIAPQASGAGIPEIKAILGGAQLERIGSPLTLLVKWAGTVLAVGGNLSVGKAGPMVHLGFCCAANVAQLFGKYRDSAGKRRELLTAGTAAGLCVAFGSPLGGVLYALEETASYFGPQALIRSFVCSTTAAVVLQLWDPYMTKKLTLFTINYHGSWDPSEFPLFVLLGVMGGFVGVAFTRLHLVVQRWRARWRGMEPSRCLLEVLVLTMLNCCVNLALLPHGKSATDSESLEHLFRRCILRPGFFDDCTIDVRHASALFVVKFFMTALCFGMVIPGGFLMPCLVMGASMGWTVASLFDTFVNAHKDWTIFDKCDPTNTHVHAGTLCLLPSVYALIGAGAVLSGVTRMTISLVTIMFELTGGLEYTVPVTVGVIVAKWVAEGLEGRDSIYTRLMEVKGLEFLDMKVETHETAHAPMETELGFEKPMRVLYEQQILQDVIDALQCREGLSEMGFPIVKSEQDRRVLGFVSRRRLIVALDDLDERLRAIGRLPRAGATVVLGDPANLVRPPPTPSTAQPPTPSTGPEAVSHPSPVVQPWAGLTTPPVAWAGLATPPPAWVPPAWGQVPNPSPPPELPPLPLDEESETVYVLNGYVDNAPVTVRTTIDVARVVLIFRRLGVSSLLVVDESNYLKGWLSKAQVIQHVQETKQGLQYYARAPGGGTHSGFDQDELEECHDLRQARKAWQRLTSTAGGGLASPQAHVLPLIGGWRLRPSPKSPLFCQMPSKAPIARDAHPPVARVKKDSTVTVA
eukprot:Hpha_TRINITY_DN26014_c0_g1::TRINITY_DN26014_c0_g1_i1::g.115151::m.115151/K05012/CLCN3_4_5; chloride channel 3/4/5